ncbi:hypothetical protein D3C76_720720 [compost metagenome]
MSRTIRKHRYTGAIMRDGQPQYAAPSCNHHGGCPWCEANRMHAERRDLQRADIVLGLDDADSDADLVASMCIDWPEFHPAFAPAPNESPDPS